MKTTIKSSNIKCDGCVQTIEEALDNIQEIEKVEVSIDMDEVSLFHHQDISALTQKVITTLDDLGYKVQR